MIHPRSMPYLRAAPHVTRTGNPHIFRVGGEWDTTCGEWPYTSDEHDAMEWCVVRNFIESFS